MIASSSFLTFLSYFILFFKILPILLHKKTKNLMLRLVPEKFEAIKDMLGFLMEDWIDNGGEL